ncbi:MAG: universal stress protein [Chitinophagaceae bacterium]|nr:universal stress protein [Chitinophagaceae bacterium]
MNSIIVPTNFSPSADNALNYAGRLAGSISTSVLLLHVYQIPVSINEMPVMVVSSEELKKNADETLEKSKQQLLSAYPNCEVRTESLLGDLREELEEICEREKPFAVVLGTHHTTGFERLLFGDTALSIIRGIDFPVVAVPQGAKANAPENIVFATDLKNIDEVPAQKIIDVVRTLNAELHVVHIDVGNEYNSEAAARLNEMFRHIQPQYHEIRDENVAHGINTFVQQNNIDLILVIPHKHNLYERLFSTVHTKDILDKAQVPIMSLKN